MQNASTPLSRRPQIQSKVSKVRCMTVMACG
jgi:hypothetical protein